MTLSRRLVPALFAAAVAALAVPAHAAIVISEVDPTGSSNATYGQDWFELTNTGSTAVDITGWKMDDDSAKFSKAVALTGVTSIAAGQSVVFIEDTGSSSNAALDSAFVAAWFGTGTTTSLVIGNYGGSGVGLSAGGDAVNIYDASGALVTGVTFGAATAGTSFDNAAGASGAIGTASVAGVDGAFVSPTGEVGSPGSIAASASAVPEPASLALLAAGLGLVGLRARRSRQAR